MAAPAGRLEDGTGVSFGVGMGVIGSSNDDSNTGSFVKAGIQRLSFQMLADLTTYVFGELNSQFETGLDS